MDQEKVFSEVTRIVAKWNNSSDKTSIYLESLQLLKVADVSGTFYKHLSGFAISNAPSTLASVAVSTLRGFKEAAQNGLIDAKPLIVKIQGEIISDFLEQAETLLNTKNIHSAAPAIIIGATLEEFLRNWCLKESLEIVGKESIDTYAKALKEKELINKQDMKDITSWAGLRNEATHGKFDEVNDPSRIRLMLEGVNLFIRKYS